jgi:carboxynorspermidine decarboxylase
VASLQGSAGRSGQVDQRWPARQPRHSEVATDLYNPCLPGSRFGLAADDLEGETLDGIDGLHFPALCEPGADVLERVLESFVRRFSPWIGRMKWVNFGGGHHLTKPGYDVALHVSTIRAFKARFPGVTVYLEPGEAVVYDAGVFVTSVLDVVHNGMDVAILDSSAETHLPDILAMPYRPKIYGAGQPGELAHTYRLGGVSCLAGDIFGDYSFARPLMAGDRLIISDAALYSFVKSTTFNGVELPSIYVTEADGHTRPVWQFDYEDYKGRLAR